MRITRLSLTLSSLLLVAACGGGGGSSAPGAGVPVNVAGAFEGGFTVTASTGPCKVLGSTDTDDWDLTQTGSSITWDPDESVAMTGTLAGLVFSGTTSVTENGATLTVARNVTFSADGSTFSGTDAWTVSTGACSYTEQITGTRGTGGGTPVNVAGAFEGDFTVTAVTGGACEVVGNTDTDGWNLTQTGSSVTWDGGNPDEMTGTLAGLVFSGTTTFSVSGFPRTLTRNVSFSADGSMFSGTATVTDSVGCSYTEQITGTRQ